jgi:hypothetical protein
MSDAKRHLAVLLAEHEHALTERDDRTPRGVYEALQRSRSGPVLDDAEIIRGLAEQLDDLDTPLGEVYRLLGSD